MIAKKLTIDASALAGGITIDANGAVNSHRVLQVESGATVGLSTLTLIGGKTSDGFDAPDGFGGFGGSGANGGGIHNSGALTLTGCTLTGNATGNGGAGGLGASGGGGGGGGGAKGGRGGSGGRGGGVYNGTGASLTLTQCTISGNLTGSGNRGGNASPAAGNGGNGGDGGHGGGIYSSSGADLTTTHCTISSNSTGDGGDGGTPGSNGVQGNLGSGGSGGGTSDQGDLHLNNTLISGNLTGVNPLGNPGTGPDLEKLAGSFTGSGINFIGDLSGSGQSPSGTLLSGDAMLAPLGDYGGPTRTMALCPGSPAIDAAGPTTLTTDQRGLPRTVGGTADIGAYETGNAAGFAAWAIEMINHGLDATFTGDADHDGSANGIEYALGSNVLISDPNSPGNPTILALPSGDIEIAFGRNPLAAVDTRWLVMRSTDLETFTEIYRYDGPSATSVEGVDVSALVGATSITVTDTNPPDMRAFYKIGAERLP